MTIPFFYPPSTAEPGILIKGYKKYRNNLVIMSMASFQKTWHNGDMGHNRPKITDEHIDQIRQMIIDNPEWHRTKLSKELCILWDWKSPVGQIKDLSCRDMLRSLDKKGLISLPAARWTPRAPGGKGADKIKVYQRAVLVLRVF